MHVVLDLSTLQTHFATIKGRRKSRPAAKAQAPQLSLAAKEEVKKRKRRLKAKAKGATAARPMSPMTVAKKSSLEQQGGAEKNGTSEKRRGADKPLSAEKNRAEKSGAAERIWLTSQCNLKAIREYPEETVRNELLMFGMVAHLTELRSMSHAAGLPATLVRAPLIEFMDLRAAIKDQADWLYDTLISRCIDSVEALRRANSKLEPQVEDLVQKFECMRQMLLPQLTATGDAGS